MDVVIPLVFPDYLIATGLPKKVGVPDMLPNFDLLPDRLDVPTSMRKLSDAGHAGVLLIQGSTGVTKYYEYGRYDKAELGEVRKRLVPNATVSKGKIERASLARVLARISALSGQRGRISGVQIEVDGKFAAMSQYAQRRLQENKVKSRESYGLLTHSCLHFMKSVTEAGGVVLPSVVDPRPISYMQKLRAQFTPIDYNPRTKVLAP